MSNILRLLSEKIEQNQSQIVKFFNNKLINPVFYNSVDLRHCNFKIAPVDVNCFPAGFNNLSSDSVIIAKNKAKNFLKNHFPDCKKILILPESHTRNMRYLENILCLQEILLDSVEVKIGSLIDDLEENLTVEIENQRFNQNNITLEKIIKVGDKLSTKNGFVPDLIISNNDFTNGLNPLLIDISQPIIPNSSLGWHLRKKSKHFDIYNQIVEEFCQIIDLDPWLISTMHRNCEDVNFKEQKGGICLAKNVDELITKLKEKYQKYGIDSEPYCYVKANNGTYGMAVMTVKSGAEILEINKKDRNKMNNIKGSVKNTDAIIQEGIPTSDLIKNTIAEPMTYLIGGEVVGNLFRANDKRDKNISLNSSGMSFYDLNNLTDEEIDLGLNRKDIVKIYEVISKLSAISASLENYK